jgi:transglutaminase-like putative cysteine protease
VLYALTHRTDYDYENKAAYSRHIAHLRPRQTDRQRVLEFALELTPGTASVFEREDYYGNSVAYIAVENPHSAFTVVARSRVEVTACPNSPGSTPAWENVRAACAHDSLTLDSAAGEFLHTSHYVPLRPALGAYASSSFTAGRPLLPALIDFTGRIYRDFRFDPRSTTIATPVDEVFARRRGVCQDFAHLGIACLRSLGLPARYVSGYIETLPPPGKPRLVGVDASHAWFSVWCPGVGWIDADPTNNVLPGEQHITTAWGRDYSDVSPLRGVVVGGGEHKLDVGIDVMRL